MDSSIISRRAFYRSIRNEDFTKTKFSQIVPDREGLYLKKKVFLGYTDISAAGSRALLGISVKTISCDLDIPELGTSELICHPSTVTMDIPLLPIQIMHCKYEEFSLIVINTSLPPSKCHLVADKIVDLCSESEIERLVVLTTIKLRIPEKKLAPLYENTFNTRALTTSPSLPDDTKVHDAFLNVLIQMVQLQGISCNMMIAPGHGAFSSVPTVDDNSLQAIRAFHQFIGGWTRLKFDEKVCLSLEFGRSKKIRRAGTLFMFS
ncbi:uncharacterized protein LOC143056524 isoform X1 [Mytilus galloprovincialis]|uniref:uncharacterized protein LOC143056524 isoform X1 n=2 Tax=Mytilus galloprovincialis TaxID=29158 RepID=UPI003F7C9003